MSQEQKELVRQKLNQAFDAQRERLGLTTDVALARHLGVAPKTISFWRTGRWPAADTALLTAIFSENQAA